MESVTFACNSASSGELVQAQAHMANYEIKFAQFANTVNEEIHAIYALLYVMITPACTCTDVADAAR